MKYNSLENKHLLFFFDGEGGAGGGTPTKDEVLEDIAGKVAKEQGLTEEEEEEKPEVKEEKEEKEEEKEDFTPEQLLQAKQLFKVLNDPATAPKALELMLTQAGLKVEKLDKKDEKVVTQSIKDFVKEKLGSKYEFLANDLGEIMQAVFDKGKDAAKEETDKVAAQLRERQEKETRIELESAYKATLAGYSNVDDKILKEVVRIQNEGELVLGPKTAPEKYFRAAFTLAAENLGVTLTKKTSTSKTITRETSKAKPLADLAGKRHAGTEHKSGLNTQTQAKSLDQIIKDAAEAIEEKVSS